MDEFYEIAAPGAAALIESMRSVGYDMQTAVADIIDNSITAKASNIWIDCFWNGKHSWLSIRDDGVGMSEQELVIGMRAGSLSPTLKRSKHDLGRFGLGLKTASFSQCRRLTVWSKKEGGSICTRRWDLDYVVKHNEWRLQKEITVLEIRPLREIEAQGTGTLVLWECMDVLQDDLDGAAEFGQQHFHELVRNVEKYLSMVFHRFMEHPVSPRRSLLNIRINGNLIKPWNPFEVGGRVHAEMTPVETISCLGEMLKVQGHVLPHKDQLSDEEYAVASGPKGWNSQQGFYVYRNHRMIIHGDWLQLGPPGRPWQQEEQFKLARLSIDIGNANDFEWGLDVRKATAKPPAVIWPRLSGLAERVRARAKEIFLHRGQYGPRPGPAIQTLDHPWETAMRGGRIAYRINRSHPMIASVLRRLGPLAADMKSVLRLVEETVPVEKIWIDAAENTCLHARPYEGLNEAQLKSDVIKTYRYLVDGGTGHATAMAMIAASEPFNRFPDLIKELEKIQNE